MLAAFGEMGWELAVFGNAKFQNRVFSKARRQNGRDRGAKHGRPGTAGKARDRRAGQDGRTTDEGKTRNGCGENEEEKKRPDEQRVVCIVEDLEVRILCLVRRAKDCPKARLAGREGGRRGQRATSERSRSR